MAENILFREKTASNYIEFAKQAAEWIKTTEKKGKFGKTWIQSPDSAEDFSDYPMLTEKSLYGGAAGIGLFFLRLYQATNEAEYLSEAEEAAKAIIEGDEGAEFYERTLNSKQSGASKLVHVKNMPGWAAGYYNGPTGGGYFLLNLYKVTKNEEYKKHAVKIADDLISAAKENEDGIYWSEQNDLCGDAGFVTYLSSIYELTGDKKYLETEKRFGDFLLSKGKAAPNGGTYWNVVDLTIIDFPKDVFWVNNAHGTSGVGWIFTILYNSTKDERFLKAAIEAAKYIEGIAVGDEKAVLVPYLDSLERGPSKEFYYLSTCHGPAGTSILFQSLYRITGEKEYLDWTLKLSRGIIKAGAPEIFSRGYWQSQALCSRRTRNSSTTQGEPRTWLSDSRSSPTRTETSTTRKNSDAGAERGGGRFPRTSTRTPASTSERLETHGRSSRWRRPRRTKNSWNLLNTTTSHDYKQKRETRRN